MSREALVAHTESEKKALLVRVNRIQGQLESIREAIEGEKECADVLQQIAACRGAVNSLLVQIVEGEIRFHVLGKNARVDSREAKAAENLVEILHRYIK
jgi:DNA-binding FrmR family transcriptional regulator